MKLSKALRRDRKRQKRVYGMREDNRSIKLLEELKKERDEKLRKERELSEAVAESIFVLYEVQDE